MVSFRGWAIRLFVVVLLGNIAVAACVWIREGRLVNQTSTKTTIEYDIIQMNGQDAPLEWTERVSGNEWLWIAVLVIGIYSGKLLIQLAIKARWGQVLAYFVLAMAGTVFVWLRLTDWQSERWGGSLMHEWGGGPVKFLFIVIAHGRVHFRRPR